ncbi:MAG: 50S ribosomal protein L22 [Bacteroidales bacterium]
MGAKKRIKAEKYKEERKHKSFAVLKNCPTSPRKMRKVADLIRGVEVEKALAWLKQSPQEASGRLHKLLLSAIANWQNKNEGVRLEEANLYVKSIQVDAGKTLKRVQPAPMGRAHPINKRSNHVTLEVASKNLPQETITEEAPEEQVEEVNENTDNK